MTVYLLAFMYGILIRLKVCIGFLSVCYTWIIAVTNVSLEGQDICSQATGNVSELFVFGCIEVYLNVTI